MIIRYGVAIAILCTQTVLFADIFSDIGQGFKKLGSDIKSGVEDIGSKIDTGLQKVGSDISTGAQQVMQQVSSQATKGYQQVKTGVEKGIQEVDTLLKSVNESTQPLEKWVLPDARKRFDEVTYLGAHNAHANVEDGFSIYAEQQWSIKKQLEKGVRHLLIDVWPYKGKLLLCHGGCGAKEKILTAGNDFKTFKSALETIKTFLDQNPEEIVSLELETYATARQMRDVIESVPGLSNYLLTPRIYDPIKKNNRWPRLIDLQKQNRRLIIFDAPKDTDTGDLDYYGYDTSTYMRRNMYGQLDPDKACVVRGSKKESQRLNQLNFFGTVTSPLAIHNTPTTLKGVWDKCQAKGIFDGDRPNFIAIDFVDRGNPMRWVNELNKQ